MEVMRRAECAGPGAPLVIVEKPIPDPPPKGVVVKILFSGLCHSDLHLQDGFFSLGGDNKFPLANIPGLSWPLVFGHEPAGVIYSIGEDANDSGLSVGDRVVVYPWVSCMECEECLSDNSPMCSGQMKFLGGARPGGFSTHMSVPLAKYAVKAPDGIPLDVAALSACSGLTAFNAVNTAKRTIEYFAPYRSNVTLLIVGAGGLGNWAIKLAKALLPSDTRVVVADISDEKLKIAKEAGADDTIIWSPSEDDKTLIERTKNQIGGVDSAIDFVGNGTSNTRCLGVLRKGGSLVNIGLFGGSFTVQCPPLVFDNRVIVGRCVGTMDDLKGVTDVVFKQKIQPVPITHHSLDEIDGLMNKLRAGKIQGRAILKFPE